MLTFCFLLWVLFLFFLFSCLLLCCFPSFALLTTFGVSDYFACFVFFFLFFLARMHRKPYMSAWVVPGHPSHTPYSPIWSVAVMCRPRHPCQPICPPTPLPKLCPADLSVSLFVLFCVCWVLIHPPAPIRTHSHPPESLLTPLCLRAHICLFWGNFPAIHGRKSCTASPFMSLFVLFACA